MGFHRAAESRKVPETDEDRTAAFQPMLSGKYRTEGDKVVIKVDLAWDQAWTATEQVRYYRIDGDTLHIEAAPQPYANFAGKVMRGILIWTRD